MGKNRGKSGLAWSKIAGRKKRRMRYQIAEEQGWRCHYCKEPVVPVPRGRPAPLDPNHATLDHVVPKAEWPGDLLDRENLVVACFKCNYGRHHDVE